MRRRRKTGWDEKPGGRGNGKVRRGRGAEDSATDQPVATAAAWGGGRCGWGWGWGK